MNFLGLRITSKHCLIIAWSYLIIETLLLNFLEFENIRGVIILSTYYIMLLTSVTGIFIAFKQRAPKMFLFLNFITCCITAIIIYSMHIGSFGAIK